MTTYIVCEGDSNKQILEILLPKELLDTVVIVNGGDRLSSVISLARSVLVRRQAPVLVFANADAILPKQVTARQHEIDEFMGGVAISPFKVVLAVPEIETIFFHDLSILTRLTGQTLSPELLTTATYEPSLVLSQLMPEEQSTQNYADLLEQLSESDRDRLNHAPPIQDVIEFLRAVRETANVA
ncbi:MAG: hypothetical protein AAGD25_31590 [Cyanobacteria bacterium P01_F01_bin.150]